MEKEVKIMEKQIKVFITMSVLLCVIFTTAPVHAGEKLVFSTFENSGLTLLQEPILREAYKRIGFEIKIQQYPAERALRMANDGKTDGEVARLALIREKYQNLMMIPVPLHQIKSVVFTNDANFSVQGYESLKPYSAVTLIGYKNYERKLKKYGIRHHLVPGYDQVFRIIDAGRYDLALVTMFDGLKTLKDLQLKGIRLLEPPLETTPTYHFVHKKHERLVPELTATLQKLKEEGFIQKIEARVIAELTEY